MAIAATHATSQFHPLSILKSIWDTLVWLGENSARARMASELASKTDEELEALGLDRSELVRRVFEGSYYI